MRYQFWLAIGLAVTWMLLSGHTEPLLVGFGVVSVVFCVWLSARLGLTDKEGVPLQINHLKLLIYSPWLLKEVVLSSVDVAKRVWMPTPALAPRMIEVKPSQDEPLLQVLYANSITLTPGTVTVRARGDSFMVHALHQDAAEGLQSGEMDQRVSALRRSR